jgi:hypothetical protein
LKAFDWRWTSCVDTYTLCNLTKHSDKLTAVSSVTRELETGEYEISRRSVGFQFTISDGMDERWRHKDSFKIESQWWWIRSAELELGEYWALVQTLYMFNTSDDLIALADVRAADVILQSDYTFGSVMLDGCGSLDG